MTPALPPDDADPRFIRVKRPGGLERWIEGLRQSMVLARSTLQARLSERQPRLVRRRCLERDFADDVERLAARDLRLAGLTVPIRLRMRLDTRGVPREILVVTPDVPGPCRRIAVRMGKRLRFRPARLYGLPVPVWVEVPLTIRIPPR